MLQGHLPEAKYEISDFSGEWGWNSSIDIWSNEIIEKILKYFLLICLLIYIYFGLIRSVYIYEIYYIFLSYTMDFAYKDHLTVRVVHFDNL